jgi:hypothetical protein
MPLGQFRLVSEGNVRHGTSCLLLLFSSQSCLPPSLTELGTLTNLLTLSFVDTLLSGTIPSELGRLEALGTK